MIELRANAVEGAFPGEGACMKLIDHDLLERPTAPFTSAPLVIEGIDKTGKAEHVIHLRARSGVWHLRSVGKPEGVAAVRGDRVGHELEPTFFALLHRERLAVGRAQQD